MLSLERLNARCAADEGFRFASGRPLAKRFSAVSEAK
jgi:hypothetical protein